MPFKLSGGVYNIVDDKKIEYNLTNFIVTLYKKVLSGIGLLIA